MIEILVGMFILIIGSFCKDSQDEKDQPVIFDMYDDFEDQDIDCIFRSIPSTHSGAFRPVRFKFRNTTRRWIKLLVNRSLPHFI